MLDILNGAIRITDSSGMLPNQEYYSQFLSEKLPFMHARNMQKLRKTTFLHMRDLCHTVLINNLIELVELKSAYMSCNVDSPVRLYTAADCINELNRFKSIQTPLIENLEKCEATLAAFAELHNLCASVLMNKISCDELMKLIDVLTGKLSIPEIPSEEKKAGNQEDNKGLSKILGKFVNLFRLIRSFIRLMFNKESLEESVLYPNV